MKKIFLYLAFIFCSASALAQVTQQQMDAFHGIASGTNTYSVTINVNGMAKSPYDGQKICVKFSNANTGASTLKVNSYTARSISINGSAVASGDIPANVYISFVYNSSSTSWQMEGGASSGTGVTQTNSFGTYELTYGTGAGSIGSSSVLQGNANGISIGGTPPVASNPMNIVQTNGSGSKIYLDNESGASGAVAVFEPHCNDVNASFGVLSGSYPTDGIIGARKVLLQAGGLSTGNYPGNTATNGLSIVCTDNAPIQIATHGTAEMMRINNDGNVGINSQYPSAKLHVNSTDPSDGATATISQITGGASSGIGLFSSAAVGNNSYGVSGDAATTIRGSGNTGVVGNASVVNFGNNTGVSGTAGYGNNNIGGMFGALYGTNAVGIFADGYGGGTKNIAALFTRGNVGINIDNPTGLFHVVGIGSTSVTSTAIFANSAATYFTLRDDKRIIYADDNQGVGKTLQSDANGVATWSSTGEKFFGLATAYTSTATATDEVAYSILIPAGTVAVNDMLELRVLCSYVASTNNKIVRTWISSANETVGAAVSGSATQITQLTVNSATLNALGHDRRFGVRSLTSLISYAFNAETSSDAGTNVVTVSARTVPTFASNTYFIVTVNRANGGDTMVLQHAGLIVHKN